MNWKAHGKKIEFHFTPFKWQEIGTVIKKLFTHFFGISLFYHMQNITHFSHMQQLRRLHCNIISHTFQGNLQYKIPLRFCPLFLSLIFITGI